MKGIAEFLCGFADAQACGLVDVALVVERARNGRGGDFDLVGVAECQDGFIAQLKNKDWTGFLDQKLMELNLNQPKYKNLGITPEFIEEFQETNQLDYAIYQQAKEYIGYC